MGKLENTHVHLFTYHLLVKYITYGFQITIKYFNNNIVLEAMVVNLVVATSKKILILFLFLFLFLT